jgi:RHS repeat-associated protein
VATGFSYLPFGPVSGWTYGSGLQLSKSFDERYRIATIVAGGLYSVSYAKDNAGNITGIQNVLDQTRSQVFGYDELNRLETALGVYGSIAWTYDGVGNRMTQVENGITDTYSYTPGTNRLASITGGNPNSFTYDPAGNTTVHGQLALDYNYNSRMVTISDLMGPVVTYKYNANNQRVIKDWDGEVMVYHYDQGGNLIGESTAGGMFLADYVYHGIRPVAKFDSTQNPEPSFYIADHLGTPQRMVSPTNSVVWNADIKPFGKASLQANLVPNNIRFSGQYEDEESGYHYNWHRHYDPMTGRYIETDPLGIAASLNLYLYVGGSPLVFIDPYGLFETYTGNGWLGHNSFTGSAWFDYTRIDREMTWVGTGDHFQDLPVADDRIERAIVSCDARQFGDAAHMGQDFFTHYNKGYRWDPSEIEGWGHAWAGTGPDHDNNAWDDAQAWTVSKVSQYLSRCPCPNQIK